MTALRVTAQVTSTLVATALAGAVLAGAVLVTPTYVASAKAEARTVAPATRLTFAVEDCEGCEFQLHNVRRTADAVRSWSSQVRKVKDGRVTFRPATRRTHGMSVTVRAPWEGHTGYATTLAWRYNGASVGDPVTLAEAVGKRRASACWEGTRQRSLTIPVVVEQVEVAGVRGRVEGSIAFVPQTLSWLKPMREVWDGVLGSQDLNICR